MAKKKNWFEKLKRFFGSDTKSKKEKKEKRKLCFVGKFKSKCLSSLQGPSLLRSKSLRDAQKDQGKNAMAVVVATAMVAESAQVLRLTGTPLSHDRAQDVAAIKIQTAFRGYLARKALQALKGLVKLQALIRGQAVRRQTTNTFKGLQSLMKIQSQIRASRERGLMDYQIHESKDIVQRKTKRSVVSRTALHQNSDKNWDSSILSQEEVVTLLNDRRDAAIKRERAMEYASSYQERRRPTTPVSNPDLEDRRWNWLDEWFGIQPLELSTQCQDRGDMRIRAEESQLRYLARRSFNRSRRGSLRDDDSFTSSPSFPSYMAATASARARFRSLSTPKQRLRTTDTCSEYCAPCTNRLLSPVPSSAKSPYTDRQLSPFSYIGNNAGSTKNGMYPKLPRMKSYTRPAKSHPSARNLSYASECSLLNWDEQNTFRVVLCAALVILYLKP